MLGYIGAYLLCGLLAFIVIFTNIRYFKKILPFEFRYNPFLIIVGWLFIGLLYLYDGCKILSLVVARILVTITSNPTFKVGDYVRFKESQTKYTFRFNGVPPKTIMKVLEVSIVLSGDENLILEVPHQANKLETDADEVELVSQQHVILYSEI